MTMPQNISSHVSCSVCGATRSASDAATAPRPPCATCGSQGIAFRLGIAEEVDTAESLSLALAPTDQAQDWRRRWTDIEGHLTHLLEPSMVELSGVAIHEARRELLDFFVQSYHLKDALCAEAGALGLGPATIEDAIGLDPANVVTRGRVN